MIVPKYSAPFLGGGLAGMPMVGKRHGIFSFGNRQFDFRVKPRFPKKLTPEFLLVDAINNLDELAEDKHQVLQMVERKLSGFDQAKLTRAVSDYGSIATKKRFRLWGVPVSADS